MVNSKGQTATEYLIILAVVIIIALIVIGVLGRIPSLGGGASSGAVSGYWSTAKIAVPNHAVTPDGNVTITLVNNMQGTIRIDNVTITDTNGQTNYTSPSRILSPGESTQVVVHTVSSANPGERFTYNLAIVYTEIATNSVYTFTGDGNRLEGIRTN